MITRSIRQRLAADTRLVCLLLVATLLASACDAPGRTPATVVLSARGAASSSFVDGAFTITLTRADVAFGPAYFCATAAASSELCATAVVETREAHPIDGLDPDVQLLGTLEGFTGDVRTAQVDLGLVFLLTQSKPAPLPGSIDGHSVVLEGTASDGVVTFAFAVALDVVASESGTTALVGAATAGSGTIDASGTRLEVAVDPRAWLAGLDWTALAAEPHAPAEPITIDANSLAYDTILRAITTNHPPTFTFVPNP